MGIVELTRRKFDELKGYSQKYKKKETNMLNCFLDQTRDIKTWNNPTAIYNAIQWLSWTLEFMKNNRLEEKAKKKGLGRALNSFTSIADLDLNTMFGLFEQMKGGWGTAYTKKLKNKVTSRIEDIKTVLKNNDPNWHSCSSLRPGVVLIKVGETRKKWQINPDNLLEYTEFDEKYGLSKYDKDNKNNKDIWEEITKCKNKKTKSKLNDPEPNGKRKRLNLIDEDTAKKSDKQKTSSFFNFFKKLFKSHEVEEQEGNTDTTSIDLLEY